MCECWTICANRTQLRASFFKIYLRLVKRGSVCLHYLEEQKQRAIAKRRFPDIQQGAALSKISLRKVD